MQAAEARFQPCRNLWAAAVCSRTRRVPFLVLKTPKMYFKWNIANSYMSSVVWTMDIRADENKTNIKKRKLMTYSYDLPSCFCAPKIQVNLCSIYVFRVKWALSALTNHITQYPHFGTTALPLALANGRDLTEGAMKWYFGSGFAL